jgi:hypothetical protein
MKKIFTFLTFFVLTALVGTAYAWQGRMAGMGKPYGLIEDESDFLTHPAKIASGEGVRYYLDYQFTFTDVIHWRYKLDEVDLLNNNTLFPYRFHSSSVHEYDHDSLMGVAFPLAKGRMGVFFSYDKKMGDFDGHGSYRVFDDAGLPQSKRLNYDMDSRLDNYALSLIYGLPLRCADLGFELGFARRSEDQEGVVRVPAQLGDVSKGSKNYIYGWGSPELSLFPFMIPYDSSYWELFGKVGVEKKLNTCDINWSVRGGYILSSDSENRYEYWFRDPLSDNDNHAKMRGDVRGYRIGSDLWIRHQVNEGLTLPFLVSIDYAHKRRNGEAMGTGENDLIDNHFYRYDHTARTFEVKAGGGVEKKVNTCGRVGAGLYYNYLQNRDDISFFVTGGNLPNNQSEFPLHREHRLILNLAGEQEMSSDFTLRGGLSFFYGWVVADNYKQTRISSDDLLDSFKRKISLDGENWGMEASLGATKKFSCFTLEPFLKAGYRKSDLSGNGKAAFIIPVDGSTDDYLDKMMKKEREEWCLGAGFSLLFGK